MQEVKTLGCNVINTEVKEVLEMCSLILFSFIMTNISFNFRSRSSSVLVLLHGSLSSVCRKNVFRPALKTYCNVYFYRNL